MQGSIFVHFAKQTQCLFVLLGVAALFVACSNNGSGGGGDGGTGSGDVGRQITGVVSDRDGNPIVGVFVSAYGISATTGADGRFVLNDVSIPKDRIVLNLQKEGYFDLPVGTKPSAVGGTHVKAVLLERTKLGTLDNSTGGEVANDDVSLKTQPDSFIGTDGTTIKGNVEVYAAYVDPDHGTFAEQMPGGDFVANDTEGEDGVLTSYGAMMVDAEDGEGEQAQLAEPAETCMAIPVSLRESAPDTMEVWVMDRAAGVWNKVGSAERQGDNYCFTLTQLGSINCDIFSRSAIVSGQVCAEELPVAEATVKIGQLQTQTDVEGMYSVLVPSGQDLDLVSVQGTARVCPLDPSQQAEANLGDCPEGPGADVSTDEECEGDNPFANIDPGFTYTDSASGLMWQSPPVSDRLFFLFEELQPYCMQLTLDGYDDWRVPTPQELQTLIRDCPESMECTVPSDCSDWSVCEGDDGLGCWGCTNLYGTGGCYWPTEFAGIRCEYLISSSTNGNEYQGLWKIDYLRGALDGHSINQQLHLSCVR